jgi:hypothetical protein
MATEVSFTPAEVNLTVYDGDSLNVQFNLIYNNGNAWTIPALGGGTGWKGDIRDASTALTGLTSSQASATTTIVYTSPTTHYLQIGDYITISGSSVSNHNVDNKQITAVTSTTFTITTGPNNATGSVLNGTGGQFVGKIIGTSGTNSGTITLTTTALSGQTSGSESAVVGYLEPSTSALLKPGTLYNYDIQYSYVLSSKTYLKTIVYGTITVESQATL